MNCKNYILKCNRSKVINKQKHGKRPCTVHMKILRNSFNIVIKSHYTLF